MPRRQSKTDVSLFPFLSVLCAVIGILVLFIVLILSTRVVVEDEKYQATAAHQRKPKPGRPDADEQGLEKEICDRLEVEVERLSQLLRDRQAERDDLQKRLKTLEDLLSFKRTEILIRATPVRRPQEFAKPQPVAVIPDRNREFRVTLKPILVEVSSSGYTVHPERTAFPPLSRESAASAGAKDTGAKDPKDPSVAALAAWLKGVQKRKDKEYLVFLVHPNGVACFDRMRSYLAAKFKDIRIGWEPFSREWILADQQQ